MRSRIALVLAVASLFGLAGCGDKSPTSEAVDDVTTTTAAPKAFEVLVTVDDNKVTATPDKFEAGLIKFTITSTAKDPVDVIVVKLDAGKTAADLAKELASDSEEPPTWVKLSGGPNVKPGTTTSYETVVDEGTWGLALPPEDDGKIKARSTTFTVAASMTAAAAALPSTDASIGATEYTFDIKGVKAGKNRLTVKNTGGLPHVFVVFGLKPEGKLDEVLAFEGDGPPPGTTEFNTNLSYLDPGRSGIIDVDLPAGKYGIACFLDTAPGGKKDKPHFLLGMKQEFTL